MVDTARGGNGNASKSKPWKPESVPSRQIRSGGQEKQWLILSWEVGGWKTKTGGTILCKVELSSASTGPTANFILQCTITRDRPTFQPHPLLLTNLGTYLGSFHFHFHLRFRRKHSSSYFHFAQAESNIAIRCLLQYEAQSIDWTDPAPTTPVG